MTNQTFKNIANNRDENAKSELQKRLRSIWLGIRPALGTTFYLISFYLQRN